LISLRQKLANNEMTFGSWINLGSTAATEIMAQAGFEWLVIDMEHGAISIHQAQELVRVIELSGVIPLVRVSANDPVQIKRVLDAGAHGIIVPMVNSVEDASQAVKAVRYPPVGNRGVGLSRAQRYGYGFPEYREWLEKDSVIIAQIEHIDAIEKLDEILAVPGIDGTMIGPYDLSGSLGALGEIESPVVQNALAKYETISKRIGKPMGMHIVNPDQEKYKYYGDKGYSIIVAGVDMIFLGNSCRECVNELKAIVAGN
jgi:2-dehydro-3-deoxyglucarate aldolase